MVKEISKGIYASTHSIANIEGKSGFITREEKPSTVTVNNSTLNREGKIICWGSDNNHPQNILREIRKTGVLGTATSIREAAHLGTGLTLFREIKKENQITKDQVLYSEIPDFKQFDKRNYLNIFFRALIHDLDIHEIAFPEYVLSRDFSKITISKRQNTPFCRFEEMNEKTGNIENIYLNANWKEPDHKFTTKVPCFNYMTPAEEIREYCKQKKIYKFIIPIHYTLDDEVYYPKPFWQAPLRNGWLKVVQSVPALKDAIQRNQLHFKYLVSISEEYFIKKYEGWYEMDPEKQEKLYTELVNKIDGHLSGVKAGGRSLTAPMYLDDAGKPVKSILIEPIEDKLKDGAFLPDASAGNSEILFAKQVDPAIIGQGIPGGKNLSGSGSDKRESYTILCANLFYNRVISLLPFYFLRDFNGWGDDLDATFPNIALTTLDKNPSGQETILN